MSHLLFWREDFPEPEGLVAGSSHQCLPVRTDCEVEDPEGVARQHGHLLHVRLLPDYYLVLGVAVRAHELIHVLGVRQVADLAARVHPMQRLAGQRVPEADTTVGRAASAAHHAVLVRRPRNRLHGGLMLIEFDQRFASCLPVPDEQLVVVASGGQLLLVRTPLESAYFLLVALELGEEVVFHSKVTVQDALVTRARTQHGGVPRDTPNSPLMSHIALYHFLFNGIPSL